MVPYETHTKNGYTIHVVYDETPDDFGYEILDVNGDHVDSCYGFLGAETARDAGLEAVPDEPVEKLYTAHLTPQQLDVLGLPYPTIPTRLTAEQLAALSLPVPTSQERKRRMDLYETHTKNGFKIGFKIIRHADYPHNPGQLYDCLACEYGPCTCNDGDTCVSRDCVNS